MTTVIFDMDGVMFDTAGIFEAAWDYAGEMIGIGKAGYMITKTMGMSLVMSHEIWKQEFKERYDERMFREYAKKYVKQYYEENKVPIKKGLHLLLQHLKSNNYKLAVASSSSQWEVEKHLNDAKIYEYFDTIVCGDMITRSKPEPEIYLKTCELLQESPENSFALEDSKSGLISAFKAGCKPIMVPDIWQPDEEIERILWGKFNDLDEVRNYFRTRDSINVNTPILEHSSQTMNS